MRNQYLEKKLKISRGFALGANRNALKLTIKQKIFYGRINFRDVMILRKSIRNVW